MSLMTENYSHLLDQEALEGPRLGRAVRLFNGHDAEQMARNLNQYAGMTAGMAINEIPASVIIEGRQQLVPASRHKATAPDNQAELIIATAQNLRAQVYSGPLVIAAIVDYPDFKVTDAQRSEIASLGVRVLTEHRNRNHAQALNRAFSHVAQEDGMAVVMPSGNRFATDQALRAAARHISDNEEDVIGVYGPRVMDRNTSDRQGHELLMGDSAYYEQLAEIDREPSPEDNGYMSPAGAVLCSTAWSQIPLDEAYGRGGSIRQWATTLQANGLTVVYDPTLAVHDHSNPSIDTLEEEARWLEPTTYTAGRQD